MEQGGLPHNQLYRNEGGQFSDVSAATGTDLAIRGNGCVAADFDMDGWTDIFVTADGPNVLLWNNRDGTFTDGAAPAGVDSPEWNSAAAVGDINLDGWPDLFVAAYIDLEKMIDRPSGAFPQDFLGLPDHFYVNNGDRTFSDVTVDVGLTREERGLGALFSDFDGDLDLDLYIANDGHPNRMYLNEPDGGPAGFHFVDISINSGTGDSGSGMGIAGGDYDGDGRYDLLVTNWNTELNALFRNTFTGQGEPTFLYSTARIGIAGLGNNMTGWGTAWADFDHDTDEDLLVVNGHVPIGDLAADAQLVRLYGNRLAEGLPNSFREWTQLVGLGPDGVGPLLARGSAVADYDNDGDLDVAINTIGGAAALLQNQRTQGNWLTIRITPFAPGTRIEAKLPSGPVLVREWHTGSSYLASEDPRLHFGLGRTLQVDLVIRWPDGGTTIEYAVPANQILTLNR
ncbi:MAG: CRTAC1 family protein [Ardenticatenales bacterium]|nr:CRTAC1 family protein [Ardenticatenales bacterium]